MKKVFLEILENSQVFSCEFCEISKNIFFYRTPLVAAFVLIKWRQFINNYQKSTLRGPMTKQSCFFVYYEAY